MIVAAEGAVGILAGGGPLPSQVAERVLAEGRQVFIVGFQGFADPELLAPYPHKIIRLAAAGDILGTLHLHGCTELVLIGPVRRPAWRDIRPDAEGARILAKLGRAIFAGDDGLLGAIVRVLENEGFRVRGAHEFLKQQTRLEGALGKKVPDETGFSDIRRGLKILSVMSCLDIGQGCVVQNGLVLAVEALEGTDVMLERCAQLKQVDSVGGVLVKMPKTGQELRADMPTIGPVTITNAARSGLRGVAFQADGTILTDPAACIMEADRLGLFLYGLSEKEMKEIS
ncbi:LpxI family protein [Gluconobacter wancherniae]|uniref:LpxI family protein n=1 Tax=Gluconobacter wancherniae TaxID=1307955 RepID=UPI001B8AE386|nr:UDP-2,3-diacylglucosamine diphosphatase LpxI [Gluconobacter wancherniae]MBS1061767.1 UDP-2,3-diacylglucosamine diphosphatase LpxI [Gluconobacter wancherniae]MBS1093457.1 UDP-2,3-diacylglucosamine diphosphatase LpxI [Gluconobacter wancherniae]